jgi:serine phosphatase RsbU (regulator of sigma subunit)
MLLAWFRVYNSSSMPTKGELIRHIPLFASLPAEEVEQLSRSLHLAEYPVGKILFREGDAGDRFSIITDGEIEIIQALGSPEERVLSVAEPGDFLGEVSLLDPDQRRSATGRARTAVRLLEMTSSDFDQLINRRLPLVVSLMREMSHRLRRSEQLTIRDLQEKNLQLFRALEELKAAQEQLLEKEKLDQELRLAREIQEGSLPDQLPVIPGWRISAIWQPARMVGGDFYDFITFPDGKLVVIIGDVTGKGMPAALVMSTTHSLVKYALLYGKGDDVVRPGEVLARVNEMCCLEMPRNMFVTCLVAVVDLKSGITCFANAGHNLPFLRTSGEVVEMRATGMPLGLMQGMVYEEIETVLERGDALILISDGLVEAHNSQREMYGASRLRQQLAGDPGRDGFIALLLNGHKEFTGSAWEQEDDITCVVLERSPGDEG